MTRAEFITRAFAMGYWTKAQAKAYAGEREEFTDADFEEVYRYAERQTYLRELDKDRRTVNAHGSRPLPGGGRTTKRYTVYNGHGGGSS